jgi:phenylacetic acid degradation protein
MVIYSFEGKTPQIGEGTYVSPSADIIGDVVIGKDCYIGPGAKIKGDYGTVHIGDRTSIQENCVLHARPSEVCTIGNEVTAGHGCILHNCTIKEGAVVGMGAIVSDYAVVGEWSAIGEGCVVKQEQVIPVRAIAVGVPAKIIGEVSEAWIEEWRKFKQVYVDLAHRYSKNLKKAE